VTLLHTAFVEACTRFPDRIAIEEDTAATTYRQLYDAALSHAALLRAANIVKNEAVIVPVANGAIDVARMFGVWLAGCVVVPVHPAASVASLSSIAAKCRARHILLEGKISTLPQDDPSNPPALLDGAGLVIFTSGSSGEPKGVVLRHDRQYKKLLSSQQMMAFSEATRFYVPLQLTFIFGIWSVLLTLYAGGVVILPGKFDPIAAAGDIVEKQVTDAAFVPTMLRLILAEADSSTPRSNVRITTAGEFMDPSLSRRTIDALGGSIVSIYGLTETGAADFFRMPQQAGDLALGRTAAGVTFRIQTLAENSDIGELQIHSPNGMVGYLDAPALTEAAYDDIYLKTGDLARRRSDGEIEIVGRLKDLIIRGAMKISPAEIDTALATHPAVAAAISVGVPDPLVGERIHVAVVPRPGTAAAAEDIKKWATEALGRHRSPDEIHFFPELPVGRTGKSDRLAVRDAILGKIR
jgi:acyl-CoA synthetase (AMP-forming)/AMP-acid ligase II